MPQSRQYESRAQRQQAYRQRHAEARQLQLAQRSLPPLPAVPTMPGARRWDVLLQLAGWSLTTALEEMRDYYDERSEEWQEGERGVTFEERMDLLEQAVQALEELS